MPNNPADVPLLTPDLVDEWCVRLETMTDGKGTEISLPARETLKLLLAFQAISRGEVFYKTKAAEEADRTRIAKMSAALSQASFCIRELLPDDPDAKMTVGIINEALSGGSENG